MKTSHVHVDKSKMRWTITDDKILDLLSTSKHIEGLTVDAIADKLHLSGQGARNRLHFLLAMGYVEVFEARELPLIAKKLGITRGSISIWRVQNL